MHSPTLKLPLVRAARLIIDNLESRRVLSSIAHVVQLCRRRSLPQGCLDLLEEETIR